MHNMHKIIIIHRFARYYKTENGQHENGPPHGGHTQHTNTQTRHALDPAPRSDSSCASNSGKRKEREKKKKKRERERERERERGG